MQLQATKLWRHPDFMKLWTGQTISLLGSQITLLAFPLTAALTLKATPVQMGILTAVDYIPFLLVALFAGVWVDRMKRRPILIWADLGRFVLLAFVPIVAFFHLLRIEHLYIIGFLVGILATFFAVAYQSFLPSLVEREQLVEGNSKLELSRSMTDIVGPGLAGILVQILTGPFAIVVDSLSFVVSALFLGLIRRPEPEPAPQSQRQGIWREIGEGLHVVLGNPMLRSIAGCSATSNLFNHLQIAIFVLYVTRELGIGAVLLGLIFSCGSVGTLLGALSAGSASRRFGLGQTIIGAALLVGTGYACRWLAAGPLVIAVPVLVIGQFLIGFATTMYNINQISLRQAITPERLLGRMNASMRFLVWGTIPIGALIGGGLGQLIGLRPTLGLGGIGVLLSFLWVFFSPLRTLRDQPGVIA